MTAQAAEGCLDLRDGFAACGRQGRGQRFCAAMGNIFGKLFTISTWGESHGLGVGVTIDGCPPGLAITAEEIQVELDRRRPGQSDIVTPRKEEDKVEIWSGIFEGKTTGTPITLIVRNADQRSGAYDEMRDKFRPSHADFTYQQKFGLRDHRGGGRSSARETVGRVAAGAIAKKILASGAAGVEIRAFLTQVHDIVAPAEALAGFPGSGGDAGALSASAHGGKNDRAHQGGAQRRRFRGRRDRVPSARCAGGFGCAGV